MASTPPPKILKMCRISDRHDQWCVLQQNKWQDWPELGLCRDLGHHATLQSIAAGCKSLRNNQSVADEAGESVLFFVTQVCLTHGAKKTWQRNLHTTDELRRNNRKEVIGKFQDVMLMFQCSNCPPKSQKKEKTFQAADIHRIRSKPSQDLQKIRSAAPLTWGVAQAKPSNMALT